MAAAKDSNEGVGSSTLRSSLEDYSISNNVNLKDLSPHRYSIRLIETIIRMLKVSDEDCIVLEQLLDKYRDGGMSSTSALSLLVGLKDVKQVTHSYLEVSRQSLSPFSKVSLFPF